MGPGNGVGGAYGSPRRHGDAEDSRSGVHDRTPYKIIYFYFTAPMESHDVSVKPSCLRVSVVIRSLLPVLDQPE